LPYRQQYTPRLLVQRALVVQQGPGQRVRGQQRVLEQPRASVQARLQRQQLVQQLLQPVLQQQVHPAAVQGHQRQRQRRIIKICRCQITAEKEVPFQPSFFIIS
jgi:hypothetical protein